MEWTGNGGEEKRKLDLGGSDFQSAVQTEALLCVWVRVCGYVGGCVCVQSLRKRAGWRECSPSNQETTM